MTLLQSGLLGLVQGLSEFLPVSSSGHLRLMRAVFGLEDTPLIFDILLHVATLFAVCCVFRVEIARLFMVLLRFLGRRTRPEDAPDQKMIFALIIATAVTGVIGVLLKNTVETINLGAIACFFIVTGVVLILADRFSASLACQLEASVQQNGFEVLSFKRISLKAGLIGFVQGLAVLPGVSRSGSTIAIGMFTGLSRKMAGEFSFLLSIPAILAAVILELPKLTALKHSISLWVLLCGMATAFISGYFSLTLLLRLIRGGKLHYFAYYLIPLGLVVWAVLVFQKVA